MQPYDEPAPEPADQRGPGSGDEPTPGPPSPRPRYWPWVVGLLAFTVLVAGGWAVALYDGSGPGRSRGPGSERSGSAQPSTNAAAERVDAVTALLRARAQAVLDGDKAAFLAQIDEGERGFRARQARLFDRIAKVPLSGWEYDYAGEGPGLTSLRAAALPDGSWIARVILHFRYAGVDSPVDREQYLTLVPRAGGWRIAGDDDGAANGLRTERDIWDLGPIRVVRGDSSLVVGEASLRKLRDYAEDADRSVRDVGAVWKRDWSRLVVVVVPRTQKDMARIIGSNGEGLSQIAAVTTGYSGTGPTRGDRVVINPAAYSTLGDLGRRVVMAHEVTHLATRAISYRSVPIWLSEGFADYVAYEAVDVPVSVVAEDILDDVRAGDLPRELPGDNDFDAARGDLAPAYEGAWLACRMIADEYGEKRLIRLYVEVADSGGQAEDAEVRAVLGVSEKRLVRDWRAYLRTLAGR